VKTAYSFHRPITNAYLVRERDRRRVHELGLVLAVLVPLGLAVLVYTWVHLEVLETGYEIRRLEARLEEVADRERTLRLEEARLEDPARLERVAGELGLAVPRIDQVVFLTEAAP
jgi:hypothetical protein